MKTAAFLLLALLSNPLFALGEVGTVARDFNYWSILDTQTALGHQTLTELRGKVVVLFFFGGGCPTCIGESPKAEAFHKRYKGKSPSFAMLGLEIWDYTVNQVRAYKLNTGVTYPLLLGASAVKNFYGVDHNTGYFVVDPQGIIRYSRNANSSLFDTARVGQVVDSILEGLPSRVEGPSAVPANPRLILPNPYRLGAEIRLEGYSGPAPAITFFDLLGRSVTAPAAPGVYLVRVTAPALRLQRRIVLAP